MKRGNCLLYIALIVLAIGSCKKEETVNVLQEKYDPTITDAEFTGEDFIVTLSARALQTGEKG